MEDLQLFMTIEEYCCRRQGYKYPPAALAHASGVDDFDLKVPNSSLRLRGIGPTNEEWGRDQYCGTKSSKALDDFHHALLNSEKNDEIFHGILSVYYWGFYADRNGNIGRDRALGRAKQLINGKKGYTRKNGCQVKPSPAQEPEVILKYFRTALSELRCGNIADALRQATNLSFFGLSFASKLLAFSSPDQVGVYDAVIAKDPLIARYLVSQNEQVGKYQAWCSFCRDQAAALNGKNVSWTDWDGKKYRWRAVDIERAHFARAAELNPSKKSARK